MDQSAEVGHGLRSNPSKWLRRQMCEKLWISDEDQPSGDGGRQSCQRQRNHAKAFRKSGSDPSVLGQDEHQHQRQHELKLKESEAEPASGGKRVAASESRKR